MSTKKVLITCPPMQRSVTRYTDLFAAHSLEPVCPEMTQVLSEGELIEILPEYDGWIIGDDPATATVFAAGTEGKLRAAVKWGVGVDNVDFDGAKAAGLDISNTPGMFGNEVADVALGYVIALSRQLFAISDGVHRGDWPKPVGMSLSDKTAAVIGFGDIGQAVVRRLLVCGMNVNVYDPAEVETDIDSQINRLAWPEQLGEADFVVLCCALNKATHHIMNAESIKSCKPGVRIVNISRGPLIDESALCDALSSGHVHSAGLEVFEQEPLPADSKLREFKACLFGSHNGSNTQEAVDRTSHLAIDLLSKQFKS